MSYIAKQELLDKVDNIYQLVLIASKRALELANGQPRLVDLPVKTKLSTIALEEIRTGKVSVEL